jgi:hypothetical protein
MFNEEAKQVERGRSRRKKEERGRKKGRGREKEIKKGMMIIIKNSREGKE